MKLFSQKNIPLSSILFFNLFTIILFVTAPIKWQTNNMLLFTVFVTFSFLFIQYGYRLGYKKGSKSAQRKIRSFDFSQKTLFYIFTFYSFTFLIKYAYLLRFSPLDIKGMVTFLLIGIVNPDLGYSLTLDATRPFTIPWSIYFIISIINQLFFIIGFLSWSKLKKVFKVLFIVFLIIEIFFWMGRGTNFGVISLITTFLLSKFYSMKFGEINIKHSVKFISFLLILLTLSLSIFSYNMTKRGGGNELHYNQFDLGDSKVDEYSLVFSFIPKPLQDTYMYMVYYLTQGYYHTSLAFDLDFRPTYFLGNNPALMDLAKIFGIDVSKDTYVYRLSGKGVDPEVQWHSAYLWFASDVSFWGVPLVLFIISYIFGFSWAFGTEKIDLLSRILFVFTGNILFFLFANNTYLSSVFYSFMFLFPIWIFTRILNIRLNLTPKSNL